MILSERRKCQVQERAVHFAMRGIMQQNIYERDLVPSLKLESEYERHKSEKIGSKN